MVIPEGLKKHWNSIGKYMLYKQNLLSLTSTLQIKTITILAVKEIIVASKMVLLKKKKKKKNGPSLKRDAFHC